MCHKHCRSRLGTNAFCCCDSTAGERRVWRCRPHLWTSWTVRRRSPSCFYRRTNRTSRMVATKKQRTIRLSSDLKLVRSTFGMSGFPFARTRSSSGSWYPSNKSSRTVFVCTSGPRLFPIMTLIVNFNIELKNRDEYATVWSANQTLKKARKNRCSTYCSDDVNVGDFIIQRTIRTFFDEIPDSLLIKRQRSVVVPCQICSDMFFTVTETKNVETSSVWGRRRTTHVNTYGPISVKWGFDDLLWISWGFVQLNMKISK